MAACRFVVASSAPAQPTARYCCNLNPLAQLIRGGKNDVGASRMFLLPVATSMVLSRR